MELDELIHLKIEGNTCLFKKMGVYAYFASKRTVEDVAESISIAPLSEDELISLDDAIEFFEEYNLKYGRIVVVNEIGNNDI